VAIKVVLADDQQLMRMALRTSLQAEPDITVVGEAQDGAEAVRLAQRLRPAVVVMDVRMPILDGISATRRITALRDGPPVRVLIMTTFDLDEYIIDAIRAGVSGFLLKEATPEDLVRAVREIAGGAAFLSPSVTRRLLDLRGATLPPVQPVTPEGPLAGITKRETAVLRLVARGLSNSEIATVMDLAPSSVKTHVGHLLAKLNLTDRVGLVVFAYENELIRPGWRNGSDPADGGAGAWYR
jgi:DNA-binding NarL/FixJ family response regulator